MTMSMIEREAEQRGGGQRDMRPTYGYYRQPNGWITVSPSTDMDELKYRREGWEPLKRYGYFDMATEWAADHPLEVLFMFGGAHELPRAQILEQGLHLNAPLVPTCRSPLTQQHRRHSPSCWSGAQQVTFPQLEGLGPEQLGPFPCRFCGGEKPTVKARDQHENVTHKEERGDIRTGEALAASLTEGLRPSMAPQQGDSAGIIAEVFAELRALRERNDALAQEVAALRGGKQK